MAAFENLIFLESPGRKRKGKEKSSPGRQPIASASPARSELPLSARKTQAGRFPARVPRRLYLCYAASAILRSNPMKVAPLRNQRYRQEKSVCLFTTHP